eukprot:280934-Amphidinium_carterae.1
MFNQQPGYGQTVKHVRNLRTSSRVAGKREASSSQASEHLCYVAAKSSNWAVGTWSSGGDPQAFSLSHTIRLEYINSVLMQRPPCLLGGAGVPKMCDVYRTGIVSGMTRAFRSMRLPDDLQKINRLVHGVARIWWRCQRSSALSGSSEHFCGCRQNEKMAREHNGVAAKASDCTQ